jgi:hypothetical protein
MAGDGFVHRLTTRVRTAIDAPTSVLRLEIIRVLAPLAILGFMAPRLAHADEWLGRSGFRMPELATDTRQPLYLPGMPPLVVGLVAATMVLAGLSCSAGWKTRWSALLFASVLAFVALSDRLAAFTVSKIGPVVILTLALGPAGRRMGVDAWRARRRGEPLSPLAAPQGSLRFIQCFLPVFYCASGLAKAAGDWLSNPLILYTHVHDSYQTPVSFLIAEVLPRWAWAILPWPVLFFETFAPLWFALRLTRPIAFLYAVSLHVMIGLMFGPVIWFALLMIALNMGAYLPDAWLAPLERRVAAFEQRPPVPVG